MTKIDYRIFSPSEVFWDEAQRCHITWRRSRKWTKPNSRLFCINDAAETHEDGMLYLLLKERI